MAVDGVTQWVDTGGAIRWLQGWMIVLGVRIPYYFVVFGGYPAI